MFTFTHASSYWVFTISVAFFSFFVFFFSLCVCGTVNRRRNMLWNSTYVNPGTTGVDGPADSWGCVAPSAATTAPGRARTLSAPDWREPGAPQHSMRSVEPKTIYGKLPTLSCMSGSSLLSLSAPCTPWLAAQRNHFYRWNEVSKSRRLFHRYLVFRLHSHGNGNVAIFFFLFFHWIQSSS